MDFVGRTLGQYEIVEAVGQGGMASVYKAYQSALDRYVAVKVLPAYFAHEPGFAERFNREARAIARLEHPNILPIYDFGKEGDVSYIVMKYVSSGTLKDLLGAPLPVSQTLQIFEQIAGALDHAHRHGILHRDIKPSNILIDEQGWLYLSDFGLAKMVMGSIELTGSGVGIGTPSYMSPEQGQGLAVDGRTDIYSLGVILFEMLTGQIPYQAETPMAVVLRHITDPVPLPHQINPSISEPVERVLLKALAKDPNSRYQTAGQMVEALRQAIVLTPDAVTDGTIAPPLVEGREPIDSTMQLPGIDPGATILPLPMPAQPEPASAPAAPPVLAAPRRTRLDRTLYLAALFLIVMAILGLVWTSLSLANISAVTVQISAWLSGNWPWLILMVGIAFIAISQRRLIGQTFGQMTNLGRRRPARRKKMEPADIREQKTLTGLTLIRTEPAKQQPAGAHETIIFHREMEAVISSANDHLIEDWLRMQDSEQISGILSTQENARLLITGFGSFGGTSLVRGVTAKLMDNFARRQQGKVLVIRLETLRGAPEGDYRLFVNENQAGAVNHRVSDTQLTPLVQTALTGQANTFNPQADDAHDAFQGLTMVFDQETTGVDEAARSRAIAGLVYRLLNLLATGQEDGAIQQAMHELHATEPANKTTQTVLIIDRIDQAAAMQRLLNSALVNPFYASWLSVIVVSRQEAFNRWPADVQQQVTRRGFRQRYIRRLWEQDLNLKRELRRLMLLESSVGDIEYQRRQSLWLAHLTYEARGSIALALRKLKASHDWFEKEGRLHIDPSAPYVRDRESIEHNAFVQKILDQHWPDIIGSLFNSPETADQARVGIYYVIDWMRQHPIFNQAKLSAAAAASEISIAGEPEIRAEVLSNLLRILTREHYLNHLGQGKYRLAWQERVTFLHKVWRQFREGGRPAKPNGAARAQGTAPAEISAPVATPPPPASTSPPGVDDTPVKVETKAPEPAPPAGPRSLRLALLCDMTAQENDTGSLVTQIAFEIIEAGHRLVMLDHLGTETLIRQKFAPYWPLYAENVNGLSRPFILITTNDDAQGDEYEQVIPTANIIKALLDQAEAIILAQQDEAADSVFSPENIRSRARGEGIPVIPVGAAGGATAAVWTEVSNQLSERYQVQISSENFAQLNLTQTYIPDIARAVVALAEQVCT